MTISVSNAVKGFTSRYGNPTVDCGGAKVRAHTRHVATVVSIEGRIDGSNLQRVADAAKRFIVAELPVVVDLSGVTSFAPQAVPILVEFSDRCLAADVDWALIASAAVLEQLDAKYSDVQLPIADSVAHALHDFDDEIVDRRLILLSLLGKTA